MLYLNLPRSSIWVYRALLAWWGQMRIHSPQSMQRSEAIKALPFLMRIASVGQRFTQLVQPTHLSSFNVTEWKNSAIGFAPTSSRE